MAVWFLWDGRERQGPMNQGALEERVRAHPDRDVLRVWRAGLDGWTSVAEALGPEFGVAAASIPVPPPLPPEATAAPDIPFATPLGSNFVTKHWRGQYPLGVAYWVIGFLSNLVSVFAIILLSQLMLTVVPFVPLAIFVFFLIIWGGLIALAVWQTVGIWRAASRRRNERRAAGKRAFWAIAAKVAVCLGWVQLAALLVKAAVRRSRKRHGWPSWAILRSRPTRCGC